MVILAQGIPGPAEGQGYALSRAAVSHAAMLDAS